MKIGPLESKPVTTPAAPERKGGTASASSPVEPSAKVELSSAASALSGMNSDASFDTAKVDRIAQAIRDGKFKVNPEAIADKLIINAEELLGRKLS
jgi:negative regulator of flagellin synthesis FlgM